MTRPPSIVVFGSINADLVFPVATLPRPGQTLMAAGMTVEPGGKGANQAVAAALDGAAVAMVGAVGSDALAEPALHGLVAAGVDLTGVARDPAATGCASICIDPEGHNQIVVAPGANHAAPAAAVEDRWLGPGTIVVTQMEADPEQTAALIRRARRLGARIVHNLAPAAALADDALRSVDVLVVNEDEAAWLAAHQGAPAATAAALQASLGVTVVRTLGGDGVEWAGDGAAGALPAAPVQVVDTVAAGDCFVGVLAAALQRGIPLADALRRANAAAGLACSRRGSQSSLPTATEIDAALAQDH